MVFDVSLEMQSNSENCLSVQDDKITKHVHTVKWHVLDTLKNLRLHRQLEICNKLLQEASFEPDEKMQFVWNSQAILKIITDLYSGRILQACAYHKIAMI